MTILKQNKYPSFPSGLQMGTWHLVSIPECAIASLARPTPCGKPHYYVPSNPAQNARLASANINDLLFIKKNHISPPFASFTASPGASTDSAMEITSSQTHQDKLTSLWGSESGTVCASGGHQAPAMQSCQPVGYVGTSHASRACGQQPGCCSSLPIARSRASFPCPDLML